MSAAYDRYLKLWDSETGQLTRWGGGGGVGGLCVRVCLSSRGQYRD